MFIINILANIIQIDNFKHKLSANTFNNNQIERFYNYNKQSPKNQFCPSFVPQALEGLIFCPFYVPRALRWTKTTIIEAQNNEIQISTNMN